MSEAPREIRRHAKEFAVAEATLLRALLETAPDIIYYKDVQSRFIAVTATLVLKHRMGTPDDVVGKTDFDFFAPQFAQQSFDEEQRIISTGEPMVNKLVKETWADGHVTWSLNSKTPLRDGSGAIIGIVGFGKDVTKTKEMEAELDRAQRDLIDASRMAGMAEVATGVLHNVGNVLNSLNVSTSLITSSLRQLKTDSLAKVVALLREHKDDLATFLSTDPKGRRVPELLEALSAQLDEQRTRLIEETTGAQKNVDHIKEIVSMQQAYATMIGATESLDAASLMEDSVRLNSSALNRHHIRLIRDYGSVPPVLGERGKILQILVNLIRNAKIACTERGGDDRVVTLKLERGNGDTVRFVVQDNGVGIAPENLTRIFMHGFTTRNGGHGFGLHSSALASREMKGSLTAQSDGPGQGAQFALELPVAPTPPVPHPPLV